ncbi:MAG TPA: peptidylprolyl isomerase [Rhodanobacteraceae bacterium]|jgi:cyclophilin family peptidyl-prolyl cis-trans isomerase|nr:peptidylprolyl isomerase [Rhodanobacteraceae bacterium]
MNSRLRPLRWTLPVLFAFAVPSVALAAPPPATASSSAAPAAPAHPQVEIKTSMGDIVIELFPDKSPKTVANFLQYVKDGFYAGTVFHRVIPGYLIQGGLYTRELQPKRTLPPIPDEANNGLSNLRGTVAAARGPDVDSATAQFFINVVDNPRLDYVGNQSGMTWGYAVFGKVVKGMDIVDKIDNLPTGPQGPFIGDVPRPLVVIEGARLIGEAAHPTAEPVSPVTGQVPASAPATKKPAGH